jgi:hypothetical protein
MDRFDHTIRMDIRREPVNMIGRYAVIPATVPHERGVQNLHLDLTDPYCLRFKLAGTRFAVAREGLQALLDAYDEMQARLSCTGLQPEPSPPSLQHGTPNSTTD